MKLMLRLAFACTLMLASARADQYIYPDPPSTCHQTPGVGTIEGYWGAYGNDYQHSLCRYYHSSGPICGMCLGTVEFGTLEVKETVQMDRGFCTQHTWMRGEDGSGIPPYYLIMTSNCGTNRNSLWVSKFTGPGC
jgi:hypothetical protein